MNSIVEEGYGTFLITGFGKHNLATYAGFDKETCIALRKFMRTGFSTNKKYIEGKWNKRKFWISDSKTECYNTFYQIDAEVAIKKILTLTQWTPEPPSLFPLSPNKRSMGKRIEKYSDELASYNYSIKNMDSSKYHFHFTSKYIMKLVNLSESEWKNSEYSDIKAQLFDCKKCNYNFYYFVSNNDTLNLEEK